jgi:hypothetical protein
MSERPANQNPGFRAVVLALLLAGIYFYGIFWNGGIFVNIAGIGLDLALLLLLILACTFCFAQFVLPVHTLVDRLKITRRLWLHTGSTRGAATFVKNGRRVEHQGESELRGPGVVWVDSASAVMTRSGSNLRRALGPGIHFLEQDERIATTFSLHTQMCTLGPGYAEPLFGTLRDQASEEERNQWALLQGSRLAVSGQTRDGNEVVPNISVVFKLDAWPAPRGLPGSRFGFAKETIEKAARAEGMSPNPGAEPSKLVAWNQLPGLMVVDLWREYLGKFTLDELFRSSFPRLPDISQPIDPAPEIASPWAPPSVRRHFLAKYLTRLNNSLETWLDEHGMAREVEWRGHPVEKPSPNAGPFSSPPYTALQIIAQMINARLTQAVVPVLDECGRVVEGFSASTEYKRLKERGLVVLKVNLSGLRLDPSIEDQLVQQWNTSWLASALADRGRLERLELLSAQSGKQKALLQHASTLSQAIAREQPRDLTTAVKTLLRASQAELAANQGINHQASSEDGALADLLQWVESRDYA